MFELNDCKLEALALFNIEGTLVFANQAFYQLFGYNATEQLAGKALENFLAADQQVITSLQWLKEQSYWAGKVTGICKDKKTVTTFLNFFRISSDRGTSSGKSLLQGENGNTFFILLFLAGDITKAGKREAKHFYDQKMDTVARMANGLAHDLNNIMTVINGYTDILLDSLEDDEPVKKSIQLIAKAGQKASDFIKQLLTIGKRFPLKNESLDLNDLIRSMADKLDQVVGPECDLQFQLAERLWNIEGDKEVLEQILTVLIINARENTNSRGQVTVSTEARLVKETSPEYLNDGIAKGEYVLLSIKDNGEAINEERLAVIFDPFAIKKEKDKSLSLGLAKAYAVVSQIQGYIFPASENGKGNTMQVYLPSLKSSLEHMVENERRSLGTKLKSPLSILVVEDELDISHFIKTVLTIPQTNYQICEASNGRMALDFCHKTNSKPDVLITDVVMPLMNGVELYDNLKRANPELKVLFISGYAHSALEDHDEKLKRINFLEKPFTATQLLNSLEAIISSS